MAQTAAKRPAEFAAPESVEPVARHASKPEPVSGGALADDVGPAMALQAYLREALEEEAEVRNRWSPRKTLGFVAISSGLLWAVILGGLAVLT